VEHLVGGHSHDRERQHESSGVEEEELALAPRKSNEPTPGELERGQVEFDVDAEDFDPDHAFDPPTRTAHHRRSSSAASVVTLSPAQLAEARARAVPLTLGLCFHGITDGLALGASALASSSENITGKRADGAADLSFVVFLALFIHKGVH
jgi:zinc transporter ZupT